MALGAVATAMVPLLRPLQRRLEFGVERSADEHAVCVVGPGEDAAVSIEDPAPLRVDADGPLARLVDVGLQQVGPDDLQHPQPCREQPEQRRTDEGEHTESTAQR